MKKENNNTFSIFDSVLEEVTADASPKIDVVNLTFESAVSMNWTELFSGFDSICAITFSSGVGFMYKLLDMFETAEGSTLFLDEINSMPLNLQGKVLRAIETKTVQRIGSTHTIPLR